MASTPAVAAAERAGIPFRTHSYEHDPRAESYGLEAAEKLALDPARVFKTLIVDVDGRPAVAIVPVEAQVDLKSLGGKRLRSARHGLRLRRDQSARPAEVAADDASALGHETIDVRGRRGLEIELDPGDLARLRGADVRPIARF